MRWDCLEVRRNEKGGTDPYTLLLGHLSTTFDGTGLLL
jgi:hypothetical protein